MKEKEKKEQIKIGEKELEEAKEVLESIHKLKKALEGVISASKNPADHFTAVMLTTYDYLDTWAEMLHKPTGEVLKHFYDRLCKIQKDDEEGFVRDNSN